MGDLGDLDDLRDVGDLGDVGDAAHEADLRERLLWRETISEAISEAKRSE